MTKNKYTDEECKKPDPKLRMSNPKEYNKLYQRWRNRFKKDIDLDPEGKDWWK